MRVVLYGTETDRYELLKTFDSLPGYCYRNISITSFSDYDSFVSGLRSDSPECVFITADGADGMEGVIAAKDVSREVPVVWFSDDSGFGTQSYRLGCAYFHKKPVSPQILSAAIARCV